MKPIFAEDINKHACIKSHKLIKAEFCTCCTTKCLCPSCKRYKRYDGIFHCVSVVFSSMGLPLSRPTMLSRIKTIASKLVAILMHLFMVYRCLVLFYRTQTAGYTVMTALFLITRETLVLTIWHSVRSQRNEIAELFKCMAKTSQLFPLPKNFMDKLFYAVLAGIYIFSLCVASLMAVTLSKKEAQNYQVTTAFALITKEYSHTLNFVLYCMYNLYLVPLPFVLSLTYVFVCMNLKKMLNHCSRSAQRDQSFDNLSRTLQQSIRLSFLIRKTEDAFSKCVFFVVCLNLTLSFTSIAYALGYYETTTSATSGVLAWFIASLVSFVFIVWSASGVSNEALKLKWEFQLALCDADKEDNKWILFFKNLRILDSIILTGWQMFSFSRGLILTAAGNILTYGLLILQTEKSTYSSGREKWFKQLND